MLVHRSAAVSLAVLAGFLVAACGERGPSATPAAQPPKVTVANPEKKLVADFDEYVGRFVAVDYVEVRARVSGYLDAIHFGDGQMVKKGDRLFTIDNRTFLAALDQTRAALTQAEAALAFAESDLKRGQELVRGTTITQQTFDQRVQAKRVAEANVMAQTAAVKQAELDVQFTDLLSPVAGRIGDRRVSVGNLVTGGTSGNTTLLATIVSTDPIRFEFTVDEASYLRYLQAATPDAKAEANRGMSLPVKLKLIDEKDFVRRGRIDFVDNVVDRSTGTVRLRAVFPNDDGALTPGMFGRIRIEPAPAAEVLLVPDMAIGTEQVRKFVYVVGPDNVVSPHVVTLGPQDGNLRVVTSGLTADDLVVVNGLMRVRPGMKVVPERASAAISGTREAKSSTN